MSIGSVSKETLCLVERERGGGAAGKKAEVTYWFVFPPQEGDTLLYPTGE